MANTSAANIRTHHEMAGRVDKVAKLVTGVMCAWRAAGGWRSPN